MKKNRTIIPFIEQQQGVVLVETLLVTPILIFVFALTIYFSSIYYVTSIMEKSTRVAARQLALGNYHVEKPADSTLCSTIVDGDNFIGSSERLACTSTNFNFASSIFALVSVKAFDGTVSSPRATGTLVYVELQIDSDVFLIMKSTDAIGTLIAKTTMYAE